MVQSPDPGAGGRGGGRNQQWQSQKGISICWYKEWKLHVRAPFAHPASFQTTAQPMNARTRTSRIQKGTLICFYNVWTLHVRAAPPHPDPNKRSHNKRTRTHARADAHIQNPERNPYMFLQCMEVARPRALCAPRPGQAKASPTNARTRIQNIYNKILICFYNVWMLHVRASRASCARPAPALVTKIPKHKFLCFY